MGMAGIATVMFGGALLVQGGTILSEYAAVLSTRGASFSSSVNPAAAAGLSSLFLVGAGGIVLGVIALLGISSEVMISVAVIAFGSALALSSGAVRRLSEVETPRQSGARTAAEMALLPTAALDQAWGCGQMGARADRSLTVGADSVDLELPSDRERSGRPPV